MTEKCNLTDSCNYRSSGNHIWDAFHAAEHRINDGFGEEDPEPQESDWFWAGYNAATERAAGIADGYKMRDPITAEHDDYNDLCKDIESEIRGDS